MQKAEACFPVADMQTVLYDGCEEHQQNGCWQTAAAAAVAAITSITLRMPLATGTSAELTPSQ